MPRNHSVTFELKLQGTGHALVNPGAQPHVMCCHSR